MWREITLLLQRKPGGEEDLVIFEYSISIPSEVEISRNVWEVCIGYFHCLRVWVS